MLAHIIHDCFCCNSGFAAATSLSAGACAAGKAPKVAPVTAMRKLLTILNAMVHHGTRWRSTAEAAA